MGEQGLSVSVQDVALLVASVATGENILICAFSYLRQRLLRMFCILRVGVYMHIDKLILIYTLIVHLHVHDIMRMHMQKGSAKRDQHGHNLGQERKYGKSALGTYANSTRVCIGPACVQTRT